MPAVGGRTRSVTTAVLPVAGLGTRFLPVTKSVPKEMLPVAGRPLIHYAVEEAFAAGVEKVVLVTAPGRNLALEYFAADPGLEAALTARGRLRARDAIRTVAGFAARIDSVEQPEPLGLGHAISCAADRIGAGAGAVLLPDDLVLGRVPSLRQLLDVHAGMGGTVLAVTELPADELVKFGVIEPGADDGTVAEVRGVVEKPAPGTEPSRLAVIGRYVLAPEVFEALPAVVPGQGGEVQLTDAIASTIGATPVHAVRIEGQRFDCGSPAGMVAAGLAVATEDPELRGPVLAAARHLVAQDTDAGQAR